MPTVPYVYLRLLELEGRHPQDAGSWASTVHRLSVGEGFPADDTPEAEISFPEGTPYPPAPKLHPSLTRPNRRFSYRRIRSSAECERFLLSQLQEQHPSVCLPLSTGWANPPDGHVPMPAQGELLTHTHVIHVWGTLAGEPVFLFVNTWGERWGNQGHGTLPYDYFDRYFFDSWVFYPTPNAIRLFQQKKLRHPGQSQWAGRDEEDRRIYGYEVRNPADDERLGWAFAVERDGAIEVEELFVRSEFRGHGHGRWLGERLKELARGKGLPLRAWVPFADARRESEGTFPAMVTVLRRMGLQFLRSPVRWAAYYATDERSGSDQPVEPEHFPERPRSPLNVVMAAALALGQPTPPAAISGEAAVVSTDDAYLDFPGVGSPEWGEMNKERAVLIRKKVRGELTQAERERYEFLQRGSLTALERMVPREADDRE